MSGPQFATGTQKETFVFSEVSGYDYDYSQDESDNR